MSKVRLEKIKEELELKTEKELLIEQASWARLNQRTLQSIDTTLDWFFWLMIIGLVIVIGSALFATT